MQALMLAKDGFLAFPETELATLEKAKIAIQQLPYEFSSSYLRGSFKGPSAMVEASHFVEFYDEEIDRESYKNLGIVTLMPIDFTHVVDADAMALIAAQTSELLDLDKFVVSLGAEHTVTYGLMQAFAQKFPTLSILQIDAHSDLRSAYGGNPYSHASVMARVHEMGIPLVQVGIRAQCMEEASLIKNSNRIHTWYAHTIWDNDEWIDDCIDKLGDTVYVSIDADGFDPSIAPAVGTAEPGGLDWKQGCKLLRRLAERKQVVGFDIVEIAPRENDILTEFTMAKLCYKFIGYLDLHNRI
ncbi:MAG: agmatinase [Flavobacteriales bacterium]|nr:agmatinase [Flavobacteriaceae bacterium]PHX91835.1 MAG: agmatinase [Flavobacteriales bacterium]